MIDQERNVEFSSQRTTATQYTITTAWRASFRQWFSQQHLKQQWTKLVVLADERVWSLYEDDVRETLSPCERQIVPIIMTEGEDSKDFQSLYGLVERLIQNRVHRRELVLCVGGGVCCDVGGLLALLYMRGMDYVNIPTSLMAQIDGAIGGKVGANFGVRKNLLGGFHHPLAVFIDPAFLTTLSEEHFRGALAEAVKVAIIRDDDALFDLLDRRAGELLLREHDILFELVTRCVEEKLALLRDDPFEIDLDRELNLGHAVAHALERLPIMIGSRKPSHGEAVAIGLATKTRFAVRKGMCDRARAKRLIAILTRLGLPVAPTSHNLGEVRNQLSRIAEHRGGRMRLVVPVTGGGVKILPHAEPDELARCLTPISHEC